MILKAENLSKIFDHVGQKIQVLQNLELEIERGETVAILGESGSGKSTLLSLIAGLDSPSSGRILIEDEDISRMNEDVLAKFRAKKIWIVFQQYHLISHLTALENVMLPLEIAKDSRAQEKALAALESVGLGHRKTHFPFQMSGGEAQRTAVARALVVEPTLILLDEPSGNLDSVTGKKVMDLVFGLVDSHKVTTVLVTHSEELASKCEKRLNLRKGKLIP